MDADWLRSVSTASALPIPVFPVGPPRAIAVDDHERLGPEQARTVTDQLTSAGYAVLQFPPSAPVPGCIDAIARCLNLGEAFLPPLYRAGDQSRSEPIIRISALPRENGATARPSFERSIGQAFHTDGTLQEIGFIKTSVLLCERDAAEGGESTLFNALAAFCDLAAENPDAASSLMHERCLKRQANINGSREAAYGPAFTIKNGSLITRYSVTETDSWEYPAAPRSPMRRAVRRLERLAQPGSEYVRRFALLPRQALLLANSRLSHGRTPYRDDPAAPRCLHRGLYLRDPRAGT